MGILDYHLDDVPELLCVPDGQYQLEVTRAESKLDKNGNPGIQMVFSVMGQADTKRVGYWLSLPGESDDKDTANMKLRRVKAFAEAFNVTSANDNDDGFVGLSGWVVLALEEDPQYGETNRIRRFMPTDAATETPTA